jgi:hypothetical protein
MFDIIKTKSCQVCDGTGVISIANGPEDFEQTECGCITKLEFEPASPEDITELMGRINQALYGINPFRKAV